MRMRSGSPLEKCCYECWRQEKEHRWRTLRQLQTRDDSRNGIQKKENTMISGMVIRFLGSFSNNLLRRSVKIKEIPC